MHAPLHSPEGASLRQRCRRREPAAHRELPVRAAQTLSASMSTVSLYGTPGHLRQLRELRSGEPYDRTGRTTLHVTWLFKSDPVVVHHRDSAFDAYESFCRIHHTLPACRACYLALLQRFVSANQVLAL